MEDIVKITEMLHSRISKLELRSGNFQPKITCYMGKQLRPVVVDEVEYSLVGDGDDGVIIKANREKHPDGELVIYKIFKCVQGDDEFSKAKNQVVRDQALREFNALTLLRHHPNFLNLYSSELDTCELTDLDEHHPKCYAIQLNYISNLTLMENSFELLGIKYDAATRVVSMNYDHRNKLVKYVLTQTFAMISYLKKLGIKHRDLDNCNFMMKLPELKPYIFDFSRASLPHYPGLEDTIDPQILHDQLEDEYNEIRLLKRNQATMSQMKIIGYKLNQYVSPVRGYTANRPDPDRFMCRYWIDKALLLHTSNERRIAGETMDEIKAKIMKECTIIEEFVFDSWVAGTPENVQIESGKLAKPFEALALLSATFSNIGSTQIGALENELPRQLIHSAEYNELTSGVVISPPTFLAMTSEGDAKVASIGLSDYTLSMLRYYSTITKTIYDIIMGLFLLHSRDSQKMFHYLTYVLEIFTDEADKIVSFARTEADQIVAH
jgi:serine/threonine protein kinase